MVIEIMSNMLRIYRIKTNKMNATLNNRYTLCERSYCYTTIQIASPQQTKP